MSFGGITAKMSAPITPADLEALVPSETDDFCDAIEKAQAFDVLMNKLFAWMLNVNGSLADGFIESHCEMEPCTTTTTTTTSTTTTTTTAP
jgi:hypothetical protein